MTIRPGTYRPTRHLPMAARVVTAVNERGVTYHTPDRPEDSFTVSAGAFAVFAEIGRVVFDA